MSIRADYGRIIKYEDTDDGFLRAYFRFRKLGDLKYRHADGSEHVERVTPEELYKRQSLRTASLKPITLGHPPGGMVTPQNARQLQRGTTGNTIIRDDPYAMIVGVVTDAEMIEGIKSGAIADISSGYWATPIRKDGIIVQSDVKFNHFAGCPPNGGRAGPDVGFLGFATDSKEDLAVQVIDSEELELNRPKLWTPYNLDYLTDQDKKQKKTMSTVLKIDDTTSINIGDSEGEKALAKYLQDALSRSRELEATVAQVKSDIKNIETERDREKARADMAEEKLKQDAKTHPPETEKDPDGDGEDDEDMPVNSKSKKKRDSVDEAFKHGYERHQLETHAAKYLPSDIKVDSNMSNKDIKLAVIKHQCKLANDSEKAKYYDSQSKTYIDAAYDILLNQDSSTPLKIATAVTQSQEPKVDAAEAARDKYIERLRNPSLNGATK